MMEKKRKSPVATGKIKKKMTKEQMQLAIMRKKETDAKALTIVESLLEPNVDQNWLMENLKDINRCHMEDVIEERAIIKLCGYVLCQKPLTAVYNQRYHISLKDKKVYDITKRKNFCSSACFGASNYLLEQMLTSPLWLRDNEEIPKFRILHRKQQESNTSSSDAHGEEVNIITNVKNANEEDVTQDKESQNFTLGKEDQSEKSSLQTEAKEEIVGCIENFVLGAVQNFELKGMNSDVDNNPVSSDDQTNIKMSSTRKKDATTTKKTDQVQTDKESKKKVKMVESKNNHSTVEFDRPLDDPMRTDGKKNTKLNNHVKLETAIINNANLIDDDDIIEQSIYPIENEVTSSSTRSSIPSRNSEIESDDIIEQFSYPVENESNEISTVESPSSDIKVTAQGIESCKLGNDPTTEPTKKKKEEAHEKPIDINLAAKVEESLREWVTDQTIDYLFGDESTKQKMIKAIEMQENYEILCKKLDRLQAEEDREDAEVLKTPALKPAPHFAVLKEEGKKLDIKVRAFYEGKTTFEEPSQSNADSEESSDNVETFLPLTDIHAPTTIRRKIFLEKLDQVLPDLLRTLAGNNDVYARASLNYSSVRCSAVKALLHTFSLSAKNIVFKTAEWTLVGLVIIKMLSLSDPYLASLLATKQANLYISMILTAYKLNSDYLNLLVTSFNPNMNPR